MPTLLASGTLTADGTEQDLATSTSNNIYILKVDLATLINGETVELRAYSKCLIGGTERLAFMAVYVNAQGEPMKYLRVAENISLHLTLKQTVMVTAYKAFPWALLAEDGLLDIAISGVAALAATAVWAAGIKALTDKDGFKISGTTQTLDALATLIRGADNDTLKTLADLIDAIPTIDRIAIKVP